MLLATVSIIAGYAYFPVSEKISEVEDLTYVEGEFSTYQTHRKFKHRRKGDRPFRRYLWIYLLDSDARYKDGKYLLENLQQNKLLMFFKAWPGDTLELGYIDTEDGGLKEVYDIKIEGESIVDLSAIKKGLRRERLMMMIFSIVGALLSLLSLLKYISDWRKAS